MTDSIKKYAKIIGVNYGESVRLDFIVYKGYNEELPSNFKYKVIDGEICYKNISTNEIFEIHPNYRRYRSIVHTFKHQSKPIENVPCEVDLMSSLKITNDSTDCLKESEDYLRELTNTISERQENIEVLKSELNELNDKFKKDVDNLDKNLDIFFNSNASNMPEIIRLWERYRDMDSCKKEAKLMYQASKEKLFDIKKQISKIVQSKVIENRGNDENHSIVRFDVSDDLSNLDSKDNEPSKEKNKENNQKHSETSFSRSYLSDEISNLDSEDNDADDLVLQDSDDSEFVLPSNIGDDDLDLLVSRICNCIHSTKLTDELIASYDEKQ